MRHRRRTKYFGVKTAHRKAMFRNMATSLFRHGRITTTVTRAKELRRVADKLITLGKEGSLHSRRQALAFIMDKGVVAKLFSEIAPQMAERRGGYTRIVRIGPRRGDGAMMCVIELVRESIKPDKPKGKKADSQEPVAPVVIPEASSAKADEEAGAVDEGQGEEASAAASEEAAAESSQEEVNESAQEEAASGDEAQAEAEAEAPEETAEAAESTKSEEASSEEVSEADSSSEEKAEEEKSEGNS
ncbi:MAG: 50S ribosomal protein L17 [Thermodesulfobacteria bacterium]|nr:50S ribosomal protein L17 [Thermodesulfobacteriota bacterium]